MEYSVGSLADLISGSNTPNKLKVVKKQFQQKSKKSAIDKKIQENVKGVLETRKKLKQKNKYVQEDNSKEDAVLKKPMKKPLKRNISGANIEANKRVHSKKRNSTPKEGCTDMRSNKNTKSVTKAIIAAISEDNLDAHDNGDNENSILNIAPINNNPENKIIKKQQITKTEEEISLITKEHNRRTAFIGNLPINVNKIKLKRMFGKFGIVESVRLRSVPIADERIPKKVAAIKKQFHKDRKSVNAYLRFKERNDAVAATKLNGTEYKGHHIRVKLCDDIEKPDQDKAIFLGNISFDAEEEELWKLFESCGPIESVRLVRDRKTDVGKGFGYINFMSPDSVELALQMENVMLKNRELRISACKNKRKIKPEVKNTDSSSDKQREVFKNMKDFQGKKISDKKKKKFDKGVLQKKKLIKKIAPKAVS